jgi:3-hydroxybutyrate dehydrogenase
VVATPKKFSILITGAGSGIGLALARHFAGRGNRVLAADLNAGTVTALAAELQRGGLDVEPLALDVASQSSIELAVAGLKSGPPNVLVNNAGLQHVSPLVDFPPEQWQHLIAVMLTGAAMLTRAVLPAMRAGGFGRIVNIGSIHALVASAYKSAYVSAKHGLLGFSKVMALETADCDITINTVCPSYVRTPLVESQLDALAKSHGMSREQVAKEIMLKPMPKGAFIEMEELAAAVEFLLADSARNITGQCITIDGGWTAQ